MTYGEPEDRSVAAFDGTETFTWRFDPADTDMDGRRSVSDLFAFVASYNQTSNYDYNGDGVQTAADIFAFVNEYMRPTDLSDHRAEAVGP